MNVVMIAWAALLLLMLATCNRRHTAGKNKVTSATNAKAAVQKSHSRRRKKDLQTGIATGHSQEGMRRGAPLIETDQEEDNTKHLSGRESEQDGTYEDVDINLPAAKTRYKSSRRRSAKRKSKSGVKTLSKGTKKHLKSKENVPIESKTTPVEDRKTSTSHGTNDVKEAKTATADSPVKQMKALRKLNNLFTTKKSDPQRPKLATLPTQEESDQVPGALGAEGQVPLQSLTMNKTSTQRSEMVQREQLEHLATLNENRILATQRTKTLLEDGTLPVAPTIKVNE